MSKTKQTHHIDTRLTEEEHEVIALKASSYGIKKSQYMRSLALNYPLPPCRADQRALKELIDIHNDLNRLGGLFKLWLTVNQDTKPYIGNKSYPTIEQLVNTIEETSQNILKTSEKLL